LAQEADFAIATKLAELLRSARTTISRHQDLINDPEKTDKMLTGERILKESVELYQTRIGEDPGAIDPESREGQLLRAQMDAIRQVVDENQDTINAPGVGFKGFIPAVVARLINERFEELAGAQARMKVTAPAPLVRNRTARPDAWELGVIADKLGRADWPPGEPFAEVVKIGDRPAFRMAVPEYYSASCLACHGQPAGEIDVTGYPKEGGSEGDLGAVISVTLFK
jgi:hypothetical protein